MRIYDRSGGDALLAEPLHDFPLVMVDRPLGDHFIDYMAVLEPLLRAVEPRIADQVFAAHDLQKPFPMLRIGARSVDVAVVVGPIPLALLSLARRVRAHHA